MIVTEEGLLYRRHGPCRGGARVGWRSGQRKTRLVKLEPGRETSRLNDRPGSHGAGHT
jgi:hypothetical protein